MKIAYVSDSVGSPIDARGIFHYSKNFVKILYAQGHKIDLVINRPKGIERKLKSPLYSKDGFKNIFENSIITGYLLNSPRNLTPSRWSDLKYFGRIKRFFKLIHKLYSLLSLHFEKPQIIPNNVKDLAYISPSHDFLKFFDNFLLFDEIYNQRISSPAKKIDLRNYDLIILDTSHYINILKNSTAQMVTVVHDLIPFTDPFLSSAERYLFKNKINSSLKLANKLIFISKFGQNEFEKYFYNKKKSAVIYPVFSPTINLSSLSTFLTRLPKENRSLKQKTSYIKITTVVSNDLRKNIQSIIDAHHLLPKNYQLEIIGKVPRGEYKISDYQSKRVRFAGYVTEADKIRKLYDADLVCYPSLVEGFGIPVIEGIYYTGRVVCSDIPVFREIAESYAQFCNPLSALDIADKILSSCKLPKLNEEARELAVSRFRDDVQIDALNALLLNTRTTTNIEKAINIHATA